MENIKLGLIGAGLRGNYTYAKYINEEFKECRVVSVVEKRKGRLESIAKQYDINYENTFESIEAFLKEDKFLDGIIIASGDDRHYDHINLLLDKGYNVLVELPITNTLDRLIKIRKLSEIHNNKIMMSCNLLRQNKVVDSIKQILESKKLGDVISIEYNQNIGYKNYAHNYVRGNWRIDSDTSPLILNKSSQDIDIISYLLDSKCEKITSFGNLKYMNNNNFKLGMGDNCFQCAIEYKCPYSAKKIYIDSENEIKYAVHINPTKENLTKILKQGPYGRCVYRCDNNVVDNMTNILVFKNGVNAKLNINGYTKDKDINIKVLFNEGELEASFYKQEILIKEFISNKESIIDVEVDTTIEKDSEIRLLKNFISRLKGENDNEQIDELIDSHIVAFAGEYSRIVEETIKIKEFYENALEMTEEIEKVLL
ncbi:MAG: Gfo/Idh/MocA family protein [Peptostreptococcaceae bacterium]